MTPEQLKASILKAAFDGKLVEQVKQDKTVEDELKELGIIESKISDEEKDDRVIPETWKLIKLKDLVSISTGKKDANYGSPDGMYDFFTCSAEPIKSKDYSYDGEYLIMPGNGANIGMVIYYRGKFEAYQRTYLLENIHSIDMKYLKYHLESNWKAYNADKMFGSAIPYIKLGNLQNYIVSFPPIEEQHQIVAKIEEILPLIEKYAEAYEKLEKFNAKFPEDMKKSILQYAIQGKLVEQRPEEGTAEELYQQIQEEKQKLIQEGKIKKEKPLAEITEDEIPFDIPDSWKWVRLGRCGCFERGSGIKKDEVIPEGKPCVRYGQLYTTYKTRFSEAVSFVPQELFDKCHIVKQGDVLMALTGENEYDIALAVTYEGEEDVAMGGDMTRFYNHCMNPLYLTYVINSRYGILCKSKMASGNIIVHISNDKLATIPIPLPPLKEQHRIVAKIEELLPYCDQLIK